MFESRNQAISQALAQDIKNLAKSRNIRIMHVCGTHEVTVNKWGLRKLLPKNIQIICGPGCPVCITPAKEIDFAIKLALEKKAGLTVFGDIFRVPGTKSSLSQAKNVQIIYSFDQAINLAKKTKKQIVHFAIGFETTACISAGEILENKKLNNFSIICSHRLIPPALKFLLKAGADDLDGFILPGHVSTIIGLKPYEKFKKSCIITGFEPNDVLLAIKMILKQKDPKTEIEYTRSVRPQGNIVAQKLINQVFNTCSADWRGIGSIPGSGLKLKPEFSKFDAQEKFNIKIKKSQDIKPGCKCGEIMQGKVMPQDCPYFNKACLPHQPIGPCMVSHEGACNIAANNFLC